MRKAYEIMNSWNAEAGIQEELPEDFDRDVPGSLLSGWDYESWLEALDEDDVEAILIGRKMWGLSPLI
ncbi:MAG: hypothetical protein WC072_09320 [Methanoregulaceae archaeon]|jgi:hypothetical protein